MSLKDLSQLDIKDLRNFDVHQFKDSLTSRPDIIINIVLIGLAITASVIFYNFGEDRAKELKLSVTEAEERRDVLKTYNEKEKEYNEFVKKFPEAVSTDDIFNLLSSYAVKHHVQILSFSPASQQEGKYSFTTNVKIVVNAEEYKNLVLFAREIESENFSMRINKWKGTLLTKNIRADSSTSVANHIEAAIDIDSIILKNEKK